MFALILASLANPEDRERLEQLYLDYRRLMKYAAFQILGEDAAAEDAVHDAFLRLMDHVDRIDPANVHQTRAFLAVIAKNAARDRLKMEGRRRSAEERLGQSLNTKPPSDQGDLDAWELLQEIRALPEEYRELLMLKINTDFSDEELAKILGLSTYALRKRLQRAREALRPFNNETRRKK